MHQGYFGTKFTISKDCKFNYLYLCTPYVTGDNKISNNPRFSTASSLEGDEHLQLDQLVVAQVHHDPIQEKRVEEEQESKSNNQFHIKFLDNYQTSTY